MYVFMEKIILELSSSIHQLIWIREKSYGLMIQLENISNYLINYDNLRSVDFSKDVTTF